MSGVISRKVGLRLVSGLNVCRNVHVATSQNCKARAGVNVAIVSLFVEKLSGYRVPGNDSEGWDCCGFHNLVMPSLAADTNWLPSRLKARDQTSRWWPWKLACLWPPVIRQI